MGGEASGCDDSTTDVLIELALWDPHNIARTGRNLGIVSDARYRFERGVDPAFALPGLELATKLVQELCGGEASTITVAGAEPTATRVVDFPFSETKRLTGLDIAPDEAAAILTRLGFLVAASAEGRAKITAPTWRPDIEGKADIVEEILRIHGVDNIVSTPLARAEGVASPVLTTQAKSARARRGGRWRRRGWSRPSPGRSSRTNRRAALAAAILRWRSPTRSPPNSRICGRACCRG